MELPYIFQSRIGRFFLTADAFFCSPFGFTVCSPTDQLDKVKTHIGYRSASINLTLASLLYNMLQHFRSF